MKKLQKFWIHKLLAFCVLLIASIALTLLMDGSKALAFSGSGGGTGSGDPYHITACNQLSEISSDASAYYVLDNDVSCSAHANFTDAVVTGSFTGTLDGQTHKITGLKIDAPTVNDIGLFSILQGATVKNLSINADITGRRNVGLLSGEMASGTLANKVIAFGILRCTNENCGGITGALHDNSSITNSGVVATITDDGQSSGGLVGWIADNGTISESYASGNVSGTNYVGGLVGAVNSGGSTATLLNTYSDATILANGDYAGGLVGLAATLNLYASYSSGSVTGNDNVGGLVGLFFGDMAEDFSAAEIHGTGGAVGPVTGLFGGGTVGNRYFDTVRTGFASSPDGSSAIDTDTTPNYFLDNSTNPPFSNWTFDSTHWRTNFNNYPSLAPMLDPYMLCLQPNSTETIIAAGCEVAPLGWGTATWEVRWSVHGQNNWHTVDLDDVRFANDVAVGGLNPGTWYDMQFRYTNDFGTGSWGTVEILTKGTAPVTPEATTSSTPVITPTYTAPVVEDTTITTASGSPSTQNITPASTDTSVIDPKVTNNHSYVKYYWVGTILAILALIGILKGSLLPKS